MLGIADRRRIEPEAGFRASAGPGGGAARGAAALALWAAVLVGYAGSARAQETKPAPRPAPIEQRVDAFVAALEARRQALNVVGAAIVVADGDRIVRVAGLGRRSLAGLAPVTAETVFAIGSVTKQFTAIAVALAVSEGRMAFEDHPRRFVPGFRLQDPDADARLNMIDLLAHRSGLGRSDVTWLLAPFTQAEMFELAYRAKPAAKLREKFLYNNTMYALAGAAVARAYDTTFERFMRERLLAPLGMKASTVTLAGLTAQGDRAVGYPNGKAEAAAALTPADLGSVAPAGAINSTAGDMGAWLRFLNAGGQSAALRIAPAVFARVFEAHQAIGDGSSYGLGFFLATRSGLLVASHGGNVPGFSAHVVHLPARGLSFALLTNQNESPLGAAAQELFWDLVVQPELPPAATAPQPKSPAPPSSSDPIAPERLVGEYFSTGAGTFEVKRNDGALAALFAGQPPYALKAAATNVYELSGLAGYAVTFAESRAMPGRIEVLLRQPPSNPAGNIAYLKTDDAWLVRARAQHGGEDAALIGRYHSDDRAVLVEIVPHGRGVALLVTGREPNALVRIAGDLYRYEGLPDTHRLRVKRGAGDRVFGLTMEQPNFRVDLSAAASAPEADSAEARAIVERAVAAAGGAEALDRIRTKTAVGRASAPAHGIEGRAEEWTEANRRAAVIELGAFGKTVLRVHAVTNARRSVTLFGTAKPYVETGKAFEIARFSAVPHPLHRWKERFARVALAGETEIGGRRATVIELAPRGLAPTRLVIAADSHEILREEIPVYVGDVLQPARVGVDYSDYRVVDGIRTPFVAAVTIAPWGRIVLTFARVSFDAPIDPKVFDEP